MKDKIVWVLVDNRPGNYNQAFGVAESLKCKYEIKNIIYNKFVSLPNFIRCNSLIGVDKEKSSKLCGKWPDLVIAAGRRLAPIARYIKHKSGNKTYLVQLMWPDSGIRDFNLIVVPQHDNIKPGCNIINTVGSPSRITKKILGANKKKWQEKFVHLGSPKVALLVGGSTKLAEFSVDDAVDLANKVNQLMAKTSGSLLVTTSRRTSNEVAKTLRDNIKIPNLLYQFGDEGENPYLGFLSCADAIIASGDSISMCSEACTTGKPVYIYANDKFMNEKHKNFHEILYKKNLAKPLMGEFEAWQYQPLNDVDLIIDRIKADFS